MPSNLMSAGPEMNELVAEKVMGWHRRKDFWAAADQWDTPIASAEWSPSTSIADAWPVHERSCMWLFSQRRIYLDALLGMIRRDIKHNVVWPDALLFLKPHHICLAALQAMGVEHAG